MSKIKFRLKSFFSRFGKIYVANLCKHPTRVSGEIKSFSETCFMEMPLSENGCPDYCLNCISNMTIRCAWCGTPIFIGDPITLYEPADQYQIPNYSVKFLESKIEYLVGCLRYDCAISGADRKGFWMPPGEVLRVPSPMEIVMSGVGKIVICHNLSDPNDLGKII